MGTLVGALLVVGLILVVVGTLIEWARARRAALRKGTWPW